MYQLLSDNYQDFLKMTLDNPDLKLFSADAAQSLTEEQRERQLILFNMLVSLFERAYLLLYEDDMAPKQARRWHSWEDYMAEWCRRPDFRASLPRLLHGEEWDIECELRQLDGPEFGAEASASAASRSGASIR